MLVPLVHLGECLGHEGLVLLTLLGEEGEQVLGPSRAAFVSCAFFHIITVIEL